ncbi:MAG: hypothetical protein ACRD3K_07640 [Edaphobacter sp.]
MHMNALAKGSKLWWYVAGFGALLFLFLRSFVLPCTPLAATGDQVLFFARAQHMLHGQVMYRDFFEVVTPGNNLIDAAILRVFGLHAWVVPACDVFMGVAMFALITLTTAEILEGAWVLLPGVLFLAFVFSESSNVTHHWYSTLAAQAALYVLLRGRSTKHIATAGSLCAISVLFTQTQGVLVFVAIAAYLLWISSRKTIVQRLLTFGLPCAVIVGCVLCYYVLQAGWKTLYFDLVVFPVRYMSTAEPNTLRTYLQQFPAVHGSGDLVRSLPYIFVYALVPYIYLVSAYSLWRSKNELFPELRQRLFLLHLIGIALFLAVAHGPRFFRLCTVSPSAVILFVWLLSRQERWSRVIRSSMYSAAVLFMVMLAVSRQARWHNTLQLPIGRTAFIDQTSAEAFAWMVQRTKPGDAFFNQPALSLYLELSTPALVEFVNDDEFTRPDQVTAVIAWMQQNQPRYVVMLPKAANYQPEHSHSEPFRQYVQAKYRLSRSFSTKKPSSWREEIWERRP